MAAQGLRLGLVGVGGRGGSFRSTCEMLGVRLRALCDADPGRLAEASTALGVDAAYSNHMEMLEKDDLDAVIISTPMPFHAQQSIAALERNVHVLCEVTPAVSLDECQRLVQACKASRAIYMMAENCNLMKPNLIVREMVLRGLFGQTYYAEGEYLHELKELNERTPWRRRWQTGVNGITYGTHSLGPILQWMPGDRVTEVCCAGSGHHYRDPRGDLYENEDSCVMLCRMQSGGLVRIRVDMLSPRPYGLTYALQGTEGAYESAREHGGTHRAWLRSRGADAERWHDLAVYEDEFLPQWWCNHADAAQRSGHDGSDYFMLLHFLEVISGSAANRFDVHTAMDMTLPGLISQHSIRQNGVWLEVPDSRVW
jgi:predicted dehydrogenase